MCSSRVSGSKQKKPEVKSFCLCLQSVRSSHHQRAVAMVSMPWHVPLLFSQIFSLTRKYLICKDPQELFTTLNQKKSGWYGENLPLLLCSVIFDLYYFDKNTTAHYLIWSSYIFIVSLYINTYSKCIATNENKKLEQ